MSSDIQTGRKVRDEAFFDSSLDKAKIIPDVLDDDFEPAFSLYLRYADQNVDLGNTLKPEAVSSAPNFEISALTSSQLAPTPTTKQNITYTLVLTDPDATSRSHPVKAEMCHWIVTSVPLSTTSSSANVFELISYYPPTPPPSTGYHRYVFVLLAPATDSNGDPIVSNPKKPKERPHWGYGKIGKGVKQWAEENHLVPVGANFFYAKNEKQSVR